MSCQGSLIIMTLLAVLMASMASPLAENLQISSKSLHSSSSTFPNSLAKFTAQLIKVIVENDGALDNLLVAPFSAATVLAMVLVGARGSTAKQIRSVLQISANQQSDIFEHLLNSIRNESKALRFANLLFVAKDYDISPQFSANIFANFGAEPQSVDFGDDYTRISINNWIEEFTNYKIKDFYKQGSLTGHTKVQLVNALYFKGSWLRRFRVEDTSRAPFYLGSNDSRVDVDMMHLEAEVRNGKMRSLNARFIELPYSEGDLSMFIILPNEVDGLHELGLKMLNRSQEDDAKLWARFARDPPSKLKLTIPKFTIEAQLDLKETLTRMGVTDLFDQQAADLSGVSKKKDLHVSSIRQRTFIQVNEKGTEAAAVTSLSIAKNLNLPAQPFVANHPFVFIIRDNTNQVILFAGIITNPNK